MLFNCGRLFDHKAFKLRLNDVVILDSIVQGSFIKMTKLGLKATKNLISSFLRT